MNIRYYISDHGFGHAVRSARVVRELLSLWGTDIGITIVSGAAQLRMVQHLIQDPRIRWRCRPMDIGIPLTANGLAVSRDELMNNLSAWQRGWGAWIDAELQDSGTEIDLIVTDICPIPVVLGQHLGVPAIGISNFTWYDQYVGYADEGELSRIKSAYESLSDFFCYPLSMEMKWLNVRRTRLAVFGRGADRSHVAVLRSTHADRYCVTLSFGKAYIPRDVVDLGGLGPDIVVYANDGVAVKTRAEVVRLTETSPLHDYIAASDLVISKAGWGILSEALAAAVPLLMVERQLHEDQDNIRQIEALGKGWRIGWQDLRFLDKSALYKMAASYNSEPYAAQGYELGEAFSLRGYGPRSGA